jgi:hypothetical protein
MVSMGGYHRKRVRRDIIAKKETAPPRRRVSNTARRNFADCNAGYWPDISDIHRCDLEAAGIIPQADQPRRLVLRPLISKEKPRPGSLDGAKLVNLRNDP